MVRLPSFLDSSRAVWDTSGKIIRYQGTLVDITEKRKMERQLLQQEEFRRRLLESFPDLILVVDLEERYSFVSARVRDLLGYQREDLLGRRSLISRIILRNWLRFIMTSPPASRHLPLRSMEPAIGMEAGAPCALPPVNSMTPRPS